MTQRFSSLSVFLASFLAFAGLALARPDDYRSNVREACRQAVAGAYLQAYDERERTLGYIESLSDSVKSTNTALAAAQKRHVKAKADAARTSFDTTLAVKLDQAASEVSVLEAQKADYARLQSEAKGKIETLTRTERDLKKGIETVFVFERVNDRADGGYPIHLRYRSPCPKFRYLCPLPRAEAQHLAELKLDGKTPVECERYASLSKIQ